MDISERLKLLPPDGTMRIVTEKKDYKCNIMIIRCPDHLRSPSDQEFHLATVDRSIVSTNYSGNAILDQLCPELPKVILPEEEKPKTCSPSPPPCPKKYTGEQKDFHSTRRGNRFSSGGRARNYHKKYQKEGMNKSWTGRTNKSWTGRTDKPWAERNDKSRIERNDKSRIERNDKSRIERNEKSRMERPMRSNVMERPLRSKVDEICPWENGKQPWNNTNGNIHVFDNVSMGIDYREMASRSVSDHFVPHNDTLPLPADYPHTSGAFHSGPSPKFPTGIGLLGDCPIENDPSCSYRNHNQTGEPSNNIFPSVPRDPVIGNNYREGNHRNPRGRFKRQPFDRRRLYPNDERNSEARVRYGDEGARHNRTRGQNGNRQRKSFNRGRHNSRKNFFRK